jgi:NitT/TauT family transport system substrate-binding protein
MGTVPRVLKVTGLGLVLLLLSLAGGVGAAPSPALLPFKLARYGGAQPIMLPTYVATELDLWRKHGLDMTVIEIPTGPEQVAATASGSIDAMQFTGGGALLVNSRGQDLVAIVGAQNTQIYGVLARRGMQRPNRNGSYPDVLKDMKGAKVAISALGSDNYNVAVTLAADAGLAVSDVIYLALGGTPTIISGVQAGQADWAAVTSPGIEVLTRQLSLMEVVLDLRKGQGNPLFREWIGQAIWAKKSRLDRSPEQYIRVARAMKEAVEFIHAPQNFDRVRAMLQKFAGNLPPFVVRGVVQDNIGFLDYRISCRAVQNTARFLADTRQATSDKLPASCGDVVWSRTADLVRAP